MILVISLDPDQVKSADDKEHRKYPSMQRVKSTGHGFDWTRLNLLMGACHLLRCRCVGQFKIVDASSWTIDVQILFRVFMFIHTLCILVTKSDASLHRLTWVFVGRKCNTYPNTHVLAQI